MKKTIIVTLMVTGLIYARSEKKNPNIENGKTQRESGHYWVKDVSDKSDIKLDRKRSHKRRRKIRKPIKGLR